MNIEEIYMQIATEINDFLTDDWKRAILEIEKLPKSVGYTGFYLNQNDEKIEFRGFRLSFSSIKTIGELHSITTEEKNNNWNKSIFTLQPDGSFNMEFIWDQAFQDEFENAKK